MKMEIKSNKKKMKREEIDNLTKKEFQTISNEIFGTTSCSFNHDLSIKHNESTKEK